MSSFKTQILGQSTINQSQNQYQQKSDVLEYMSNLGILKSVRDSFIPPDIKKAEIDRDRIMLRTRLNQAYPFTDNAFPPIDSSLSYKKRDKKFKDVIWKRIKNIYSNSQELEIMKNVKNIQFKISSIINDIYFISALNILSQTLSPLIRIFEVFNNNDAGMYSCWLNIQGQWQLIIIDDNFPILDDKYPFGTSSSGIWTLILEKCFAKAYGSYNSIHGGYINHCLTDLTGFPTEIRDYTETEIWWDCLKKWLIDRNFIVFAETEEEDKKEKQNVKSNAQIEPLKNGYSYPVLDLKELNLGNHQIVKLIQMRSPDENGVFCGEWSYTSSKWTQDIREKFEVEQVTHEDLTFWVTLEELKQYFITIGAVKQHENYQYTWMKLKDDQVDKKNRYVIQVQMEKETHIYFTIHQKDERIVRTPIYEHSPVRVLLAKENISDSGFKSYEFVGGHYDYGREVILEEFLEPGTYVLTVEIMEQNIQTDSGQNIELDPILSLYAANLPKKVQIQKNEQLLDIQKKILKNMSIYNPFASQKVRDYSKNGEPGIVIYSDMIFGLIYFYYQNNGNKKIREQVTMSNLQNIQIQLPYKDSYNFSVELNPNSETIVLYKYTKGENFSFNSSIKAALDNVPGQEFKQGDMRERVSMRPTKKPLLETDLVKDLENKNEYDINDLTKFMVENGNQTKRMWNDQEINVMVYFYQHIEGIIIMFMNYTDYTYEEVVVLELDNLDARSVQNKKNFEGDSFRCILKPYEHTFLFLTSISKKDPFGFKTRSYYKYYNEDNEEEE